MFSVGAATAIWGIWTAIELSRPRHREIPSRVRDQGSASHTQEAEQHTCQPESVGLGLAFSNWWTLVCSLLPYLVAIGYRIRVEEAVLLETFGPAYAEYAQTTKRILPWVY